MTTLREESPRFPLPALECYRPDGNLLYQFWMGLRFGWFGLGLLFKSPRLQLLSIVPTVLTGGMFTALLWFGVTFVRHAIAQWVTSLPNWLAATAGIIGSSLAAVVLLLIAYVVFIPIVGVIAGPFRDAMSAHTEQLLRGTVTDQGLNFFQSLIQTALLLGFQVAVLVILVAINFAAPGVSTILSVAIALYMTTLDMIDPALGLRGYPLRKKLAFMRSKFPLLVGFGVISFVVFLVPILNFIVLPITTIGGTIIVIAAVDTSDVSAELFQDKGGAVK